MRAISPQSGNLSETGLIIELFDQWDGPTVPAAEPRFSWRAESAEPRFSWRAESAEPRFSWRAAAA